MLVYHGTTWRNARGIALNGFVPKKATGRVWFTQSKGYARRRARTKAKQRRDRAMVLMCELDLPDLRRDLGAGRVMYRNRIVSVQGPVPASVLISPPSMDLPGTPEDLAGWVNRLLGLEPHRGVGKRHPGVDRLSRWVNHRLESNPGGRIRDEELLERAQQWLPEYFKRFDAVFEPLQMPPKVEPGEAGTGVSPVEPGGKGVDPREEEALDCLTSKKPDRRARGLALLAELREPDLFEWCMMYLEDESIPVRVAALETMRGCEDAEADFVEPFAASEEKRIRAAAVAVLTRHAGADAPVWFRNGLTDPSAHVRVNTARYLEELDFVAHRDIFELALYDANPKVAQIAEKLTAGKGVARETW